MFVGFCTLLEEYIVFTLIGFGLHLVLWAQNAGRKDSYSSHDGHSHCDKERKAEHGHAHTVLCGLQADRWRSRKLSVAEAIREDGILYN